MISIITVNYNNAKGLLETLKSVHSQTYDTFEHIVIDGASTDFSLEVIKGYKTSIDYYISEPDNGVYHAMNKGLRQASGDYVLFLNSGDTLENETILETVAKQVNGEYGLYYGNINLIYKESEKLKTYPQELNFNFFFESSLPHPATFIKRKLFDSIFYYNENYKIVSDWEFFLCAVCKHEVSYCYLNMVISNYDMSGISSVEENKSLIIQEKNSVYKTHFKWLYKDYRDLKSFKTQFLNKRSKTFLELEKFKVTRGLQSILFFVFNTLVKFKKLLKRTINR
ncbi:glycosyltransferase family 2 protein [Urechidicola sp. KH5]